MKSEMKEEKSILMDLQVFFVKMCGRCKRQKFFLKEDAEGWGSFCTFLFNSVNRFWVNFCCCCEIGT